MTLVGTIKPGNVPTDRISPILALAIRQRWPHGDGIDVLAEKAGCSVSVVEKILSEEQPGVTFDLADRLLCGVGAQGAWWGELSDVYYGTEFRETCALHSCGKNFREQGSGPTRKQYCSQRCQRLDFDVTRGVRPGLRRRARGLCYRGHKLTPDNLVQGSRCKVCHNERTKLNNRRYRAERKALLAT